MNHVPIISMFLLIVAFCSTSADAQNPFPQTDLYKELELSAITRSSSSTANEDPNEILTDLAFVLNTNGLITKKITFPGERFEREEYKIYKADSLLIEEGEWGHKKSSLAVQKIYNYDDLNRLIEEIYNVSEKLRSTKNTLMMKIQC